MRPRPASQTSRSCRSSTTSGASTCSETRADLRVAGVDGTKRGWVAVVLDDGRFSSDFVCQPIACDFEELADAEVIAIDVPIGFGPRKADLEARAFLVGAAGTVFKTPTREQLERSFGPGLGVSAQSHALGERILHVTQLARSDTRLREVHPEVSFRAMNNGRALQYRKKSAGGAFERTELLRRHGIELDTLGAAAYAPLDDVLDAAAAAWSAQTIASGSARSLPDPPDIVDGYPVAIWY
jgi:predicted RNase H-like nuclease